VPVNLSIKNVPEELATALRYRAASNQRTIQQELMHILKEALKDQKSVTIDAFIEQAAKNKQVFDQAALKAQASKNAQAARAAQAFEQLLSCDTDDDTMETESWE
jgi:plasmid stability protein